MSYIKLNLTNGTKLMAHHMQHIENGIEIANIDFDKTVHSINHRGYSLSAPENTLPAYILSKEKGFSYVEADVSFTKDNVAVLLHDSTIDRTSNGSGNINTFNYEDLLQYDFGSWKDEKYSGTHIPTFSEFIILCKNIGLHPYIELKSSGAYTESQIQQIVSEVKACGMRKHVTWISFNKTFLDYVKTADETARLGFLVSSDANDTNIAQIKTLQTENNEVFLDLKYSLITNEGINKCIQENIPLEVWTINDENIILELNPYITGITSDSLIGGQVLYNYGISSIK